MWRIGDNNQTTNLLPLGSADLGSDQTPFQQLHVHNAHVYDAPNIVGNTEHTAVNGQNQVVLTSFNQPSYPTKWTNTVTQASSKVAYGSYLFPSNDPNFMILYLNELIGVTTPRLYVVNKTTLELVDDNINYISLGGPFYNYYLFEDLVYTVEVNPFLNNSVLRVLEVSGSGVLGVVKYLTLNVAFPSLYVGKDPYSDDIYAYLSNVNGSPGIRIYNVSATPIVEVPVTNAPNISSIGMYVESNYIYTYNNSSGQVEVYQLISSNEISALIYSIDAESITRIIGYNNEYGPAIFVIMPTTFYTINRIGSSFIANKANLLLSAMSPHYLDFQPHPVVGDYLWCSSSDGTVYTLNTTQANSSLPILLNRFSARRPVSTAINMVVDPNYTIYVLYDDSTNYVLSKWIPV